MECYNQWINIDQARSQIKTPKLHAEPMANWNEYQISPQQRDMKSNQSATSEPEAERWKQSRSDPIKLKSKSPILILLQDPLNAQEIGDWKFDNEGKVEE